jgi:hypothetical protein
VQLITPSRLLQRWGIDIVSKLTPAQGNYTFAVVAVEYFTKWVEVKPLNNVSSASIKIVLLTKHHMLLWRTIAYHY